MRHIISILLENEAGALSRVSGLFSARGYNIESLTVAPTNDATVSRITVVTAGSDDVIEQIEKQLNKLIDVVQVIDLTADEHIEREMVLLKLHSTEISQSTLDDLTRNYGGKVVDRTGDMV
ncbi:MAG: acetolactate synthase small subunit, partial [Proteobacteria bacterium]|nr:acetolactate synthase small subunit [Pseudomonadota bacterium]